MDKEIQIKAEIFDVLAQREYFKIQLAQLDEVKAVKLRELSECQKAKLGVAKEESDA